MQRLGKGGGCYVGVSVRCDLRRERVTYHVGVSLGVTWEGRRVTMLRFDLGREGGYYVGVSVRRDLGREEGVTI